MSERKDGTLPKLPQLSFVGGEISGDVGARVDLDLHAKSAAVMENVIPMPFGGAYTRPGTKFVDYCPGAVRVTPFTFNSGQTYMLVWFDQEVRFYTDGAPVYDSSFSHVIDDISDLTPDVSQEITTATDHGLLSLEYFAIIGTTQHELNGRIHQVFGAPPAGPPYEIKILEPGTDRTQGAIGGTVTRHYSVTLPYLAADIPFVKFEQSGDTIFMTHPDYPPATLVRGTAHDDWTYTAQTYAPTLNSPSRLDINALGSSDSAGASATDQEIRLQYALSRVAWDGSESFPLLSDVFTKLNSGLGFSNTSLRLTVVHGPWYDEPTSISEWADPTMAVIETTATFAVGVDYIVEHFTYVEDGTHEDMDAAVALFEGAITTITQRGATNFWELDDIDGSGLWGAEASAGLFITQHSDYLAEKALNDETAFFRLYRRGSTGGGGRACDPEDEVWALLTEVPVTVFAADQSTVRRRMPYILSDRGDLAESYATTPVEDNELFQVAGDYPATVQFFEQRLLYGGSTNKPKDMQASRSAAFNDFFARSFVMDTGPLFFPVGGKENEEIRHLVAGDELIVMTAGGEATVVQPGEPMIPGTLAPRVQTKWGSSHARPVQVGESIIFVQNGGDRVRDLQYSPSDSKLTSGELSLMAHHIFDGKQIVDMAYCKRPVGLIWVSLDDGTLACLTYLREQNIWGWSRHNFPNGLVKSIASIYEEGEDHLYMIVERTIMSETVQYLERLQPQMRTNTAFEDAWCLDSALELPVNANKRINQVYDNGDGTLDIEFAVADAFATSTYITIEGIDDPAIPDGTYFLGSSWYDGSNKRIELKQAVSFFDPVPLNKTFTEAPWPKGRACYTEITGLWHMRGETVSVWSKFGWEQNPTEASVKLVVDEDHGSMSAVALEFLPTSKMIVGYPKEFTLETLRLDTAGGKLMGKRLRTPKAVINMLGSQRFMVGTNENSMRVASNWPAIGTADDLGAIKQSGAEKSGAHETTLSSSFELAGKVIIKSQNSGPVRILSIVPEVQVGD